MQPRHVIQVSSLRGVETAKLKLGTSVGARFFVAAFTREAGLSAVYAQIVGQSFERGEHEGRRALQDAIKKAKRVKMPLALTVVYPPKDKHIPC